MLSPARNFPENLRDFVRTITGSQKRYVFPITSSGGIAVDALGSLVPTGDSAVQVFAEDGVLGGIDNRGQPRPVFAQLLGRPAVQFFICPAQFFGDSFAIADVADRAEHEHPILCGNWAETDFDREFRAVAASSVEIQSAPMRRVFGVAAKCRDASGAGGDSFREREFRLSGQSVLRVVAE
jgi:hypothetical protein